MKVIDIIKDANANLLRNKLRTFLTILAIFIGSFAIVSTSAIQAGVIRLTAMAAKVISLSSTKIQWMPSKASLTPWVAEILAQSNMTQTKSKTA